MQHFQFKALPIHLAGLDACRELFEPIFLAREEELLLAALLNHEGMLIEIIGIPGSRNQIEVEPPAIFRRAVAQDARSQARNRELALARLEERLRSALKVRRSRTATRPTRASKERRLAAKRGRSDVKKGRRRPEY